MKGFFIGLALISFGLGFSLVVSATTEQLRGETAANYNRSACRYGADNIQVTAVPSASTASTGLTGGTRYQMQCSSASYFDQNASGGADTATSADRRIIADQVIEFWAKPGDTMTLRAVAATGTCDLLECQ